MYIPTLSRHRESFLFICLVKKKKTSFVLRKVFSSVLQIKKVKESRAIFHRARLLKLRERDIFSHNIHLNSFGLSVFQIKIR